MTIQAKSFENGAAQFRFHRRRAESHRRAGRRAAEDARRRRRRGRRGRAPARASHRGPGQGEDWRMPARACAAPPTMPRKATDRYVHDNPWKSIAYGAAAGAAVAIIATALLRRRRVIQELARRAGFACAPPLAQESHAMIASLALLVLLADRQGATTLPRHGDVTPAQRAPVRQERPTDPLFDQKLVATDDPAFVLARDREQPAGASSMRAAREKLLSKPETARGRGEDRQAERGDARAPRDARQAQGLARAGRQSATRPRRCPTSGRGAHRRELHRQPDFVSREHVDAIPRAARRQRRRGAQARVARIVARLSRESGPAACVWNSENPVGQRRIRGVGVCDA